MAKYKNIFDHDFKHKYFGIGLILFSVGAVGKIFPNAMQVIFWICMGIGIIGMWSGIYKNNYKN